MIKTIWRGGGGGGRGSEAGAGTDRGRPAIWRKEGGGKRESAATLIATKKKPPANVPATKGEPPRCVPCVRKKKHGLDAQTPSSGLAPRGKGGRGEKGINFTSMFPTAFQTTGAYASWG